MKKTKRRMMSKLFMTLSAIMLSAMSLMGVFTLGGCISCRTEAEMVEEKSFVDGYFKYYYINETDSYAIVGDGDVPYPETLAIPHTITEKK